MSEIGSPREIRDIKTPQDTNELSRLNLKKGLLFRRHRGFGIIYLKKKI